MSLCDTGQVIVVDGIAVRVPVPCAHPLIDKGDPPPDEEVDVPTTRQERLANPPQMLAPR